VGTRGLQGGGVAEGPEKILNVSFDSEIGYGTFKNNYCDSCFLDAQHMVSLNILGGPLENF